MTRIFQNSIDEFAIKLLGHLGIDSLYGTGVAYVGYQFFNHL